MRLASVSVRLLDDFWITPIISRYILSCGKDSTVKLWEVGTGRLVKQYVGATHTHLRCQVGSRLGL